MMTLKKRTKKKFALWCLTFGMFFLPAGYDALFKFVMDLAKSYWVADIMFYCISLILFCGYFYFSDTNPITAFMKMYKRNLRRMKKLKSKMPWLLKNKRKKKAMPSQSQASK